MGRGRRGTTAAVLLALSLTAACGSGDDDVPAATVGPSPQVVTDGSTTTTEPADTTTSTTSDADAGPGTTTKAPATTAAPAVTAPPVTTPAGPVALTPAVPGTYRYATSGSTTFNGQAVPFPAVTTNVIDPPAGARQHSARNLRDPAGNGSLIEYTFEYRADGVYLAGLRITTTVSPYPPGVVDLVPPAPLLFLATGAGPGASRTLDIPLSTGGTARVLVEVVGSEAITIGGQSLDTLVLRTTSTLPPGQVTGSQTITVNLDRGSRVWVRERGGGDAAAAGIVTIHSEYSAIIQSLTPG